MQKPITNYQELLRKIEKSTAKTYPNLEVLLCAAISFGVPLDEQTDMMVAFVTICNWQRAIHNQEGELTRFYIEYVHDDLVTTAKFLQKSRETKLYKNFQQGIHDYKDPDNQNLLPQWITKIKPVQTWIAKNSGLITTWKKQVLQSIWPQLRKSLAKPMLSLPEACLEYSEIYLDKIGDAKAHFIVTKCAAEK